MIDLRVHRQRRLVPQQHVQELEIGHVAPDHHQADRQRRRHQQADRPPQPGPEHRGDQDADRRNARLRAVDQRLHHVVADQLDEQEQPEGQQRLLPAGEDRQRDQDRQRGRDPGAEVGDEAQHGREQPPEQGVRHADEEQPDADGGARAAVDQALHQQVAADPLRASSSACVEALSRPWPNRRRRRSRRSSRWISMKITKMITRPAVPSGPSRGNSVVRSTVSGVSGGSTTVTGRAPDGAAARAFPSGRAPARPGRARSDAQLVLEMLHRPLRLGERRVAAAVRRDRLGADVLLVAREGLRQARRAAAP